MHSPQGDISVCSHDKQQEYRAKRHENSAVRVKGESWWDNGAQAKGLQAAALRVFTLGIQV